MEQKLFLAPTPANIFEILDASALAEWVQGDGFKCGPGVVLCTDSFSLEDTIKLLNVIIIKFTKKCTLRAYRKGYRIYIIYITHY